MPPYTKGEKQTVVIIEANHFVNYVHNFIQNPAVKVKSTCRGNSWGIISVNFGAIGQLLIVYSAFVTYLRKK